MITISEEEYEKRSGKKLNSTPSAPAAKAAVPSVVAKADTKKIEAVSRVAYERANTALKVADGFTDLVSGLKTAIEGLSPKKSYNMKVLRSNDGLIQSIKIEVE